MPLDQATIERLTALKNDTSRGTQYHLHSSPYPRVEQHGPLRFYDTEMRCVSKRCGCPTHMKLEGAPKCSIHALMELNSMVIRMTEQRRKELSNA